MTEETITFSKKEILKLRKVARLTLVFFFAMVIIMLFHVLIDIFLHT